MIVHRVDLKWSLWSADESTWEERNAVEALAAMKDAAAGGEVVRIHTTPRKEGRYGTVEIGCRPDHFKAEYDRLLPELNKAYDALDDDGKERVARLDDLFHAGDRAGLIAWAQETLPDAFRAPEPPAPTNVAYVRFQAIWDAPRDLVPDSVPEDRREEIEELIRVWLYDNTGGFADDPDDSIGAQIEADVTADSFEELLSDIDEIEAALIDREKQNSAALDAFLAEMLS